MEEKGYTGWVKLPAKKAFKREVNGMENGKVQGQNICLKLIKFNKYSHLDLSQIHTL